MGRRTRECYLCGEKYHYCPTCTQDKSKPTWMVEFHEENCKTIFQLCTDFNMKFLTKDEAKKALSKCNLSNKASFRASVQKTIATIFTEDEKPVEKKLAEKKPAPAVQKAVKAPVAPKAVKTPVVEKTEPVHEVVDKTEEK